MFPDEVKLYNIGFGGVSLFTKKELHIGEVYTLTLETDENTISLNCAVVWNKIYSQEMNDHGEISPLYLVGMHFADILSYRITDLLSFIRSKSARTRFKFRFSGKKFNFSGSSRIQDGILYYHRHYSVYQIGLGGMLIETEQCLGIEDRLKMQMNFPRTVDPFNVLGRIIYCLDKSVNHHETFHTGIEFVDMSKRDLQKLKEFIDSLKEQ
jgi:Tfp pilus assembly protein PilZ